MAAPARSIAYSRPRSASANRARAHGGQPSDARRLRPHGAGRPSSRRAGRLTRREVRMKGKEAPPADRLRGTDKSNKRCDVASDVPLQGGRKERLPGRTPRSQYRSRSRRLAVQEVRRRRLEALRGERRLPRASPAPPPRGCCLSDAPGYVRRVGGKARSGLFNDDEDLHPWVSYAVSGYRRRIPATRKYASGKISVNLLLVLMDRRLTLETQLKIRAILSNCRLSSSRTAERSMSWTAMPIILRSPGVPQRSRRRPTGGSDFAPTKAILETASFLSTWGLGESPTGGAA